MTLLFPLAASLLYVTAALYVKRAADLGVSIWHITFVVNLFTAATFGFLWFFGGKIPSWELLWQPALVALVFMSGQILMVMALGRGDVSVATPVLGTKILIVAGLQAVLTTDPVPPILWVAAVLASGAVVLLSSKGQSKHQRVGFTLVTSFFCGAFFALFDILVQKWSPAWGIGRFLPILFAFATLYTLAFLPFLKTPLTRIPAASWRWLGPGALLMAAQAMGIVCGIAHFGRATEMNVVYSSRGLWSVIAIWLVGHWFHNREREVGKSVLLRRLIGALLLMGALVLALT